MKSDYKPSFLSRALATVAPAMGLRRMAAERTLHKFRYDGAEMTHKRASAPYNMSPNSFDVQRDRLQLMREAEDMERNFAPAKMLNRKVSMYCSPISYHAQTGDHSLDSDVEAYLETEVFPLCDITQRYDFFKMIEFGIMGMNRGGDYGWAFQRPGLEDGMSPEDAARLPLKIQAIEPDRIGGVYQNIVSNDYVSGLSIGKYGEVTAFRVFHRSIANNMYDSPVDIPAADFVHMTDPLRIDQYRGVSVLATAIQNLRDLYEMIDFVKGKAKIASALTVFTNSNAAGIGAGAMDAYATNLFPGNSTGLQQDINFGQINHLAGGTDIKFPASNSPSSEEQALMTLLLKLVAMSYNLPYSFALDAAALGGVSSRLESEMAKAEFERLQRVVSPHATRIKNTLLLDAVAKDIFPAKLAGRITRGRWGYRSHPQPDLGREASAAVNLWQNGLLNPLKHWIDDAQDPEAVADEMGRWYAIKRDTATKYGAEIEDIFGAGMAKPMNQTESTTEITTTDTAAKTFTRHNFGKYDAMIKAISAENQKHHDRIAWIRGKLADLEKKGPDFSPSLVERLRKEIDTLNAEIEKNRADRQRLRNQNTEPAAKPEKEKATPEQQRAKDIKHVYLRAIAETMKRKGSSEAEAYAAAFAIMNSDDFSPGKILEEDLDYAQRSEGVYLSAKRFSAINPDESNDLATLENLLADLTNENQRLVTFDGDEWAQAHVAKNESTMAFLRLEIAEIKAKKTAKKEFAADWEEGKHPRGDDGKFGGGGATSKPNPLTDKTKIGNAASGKHFDDFLIKNGVGNDQLNPKAGDQGVGTVQIKEGTWEPGQFPWSRDKTAKGESALVFELGDGTFVAWNHSTNEIHKVSPDLIDPNPHYKKEEKESPTEQLSPDEYWEKEKEMLGSSADKEEAEESHKADILIAVGKRSKISAPAVDGYAIDIPDGYSKQGQHYVYKP